MVTVFLRHDQSRPVPVLSKQLEEQGFFTGFPPESMEVVSWYALPGFGQVVTLRLPPERLRELNVAIESRAWGAFRTELYTTYDFAPIALARRAGK
jgi:hypothetical protein